MAIKTRVPDPTEQYDVTNQRSIVRAINSIVGQINSSYKPEGSTIEEAQKLAYFLGTAPQTPSYTLPTKVGGENPYNFIFCDTKTGQTSWDIYNEFPTGEDNAMSLLVDTTDSDATINLPTGTQVTNFNIVSIIDATPASGFSVLLDAGAQPDTTPNILDPAGSYLPASTSNVDFTSYFYSATFVAQYPYSASNEIGWFILGTT